MAAEIFCWKFCILRKEAHFILSLYLLFLLIFPSLQSQIPSHPGYGNLSLMRRKSEGHEKVIWGDKIYRFAAALLVVQNFQKKISGRKYIFWAHIMLMVHIPFKDAFLQSNDEPYFASRIFIIIRQHISPTKIPLLMGYTDSVGQPLHNPSSNSTRF